MTVGHEKARSTKISRPAKNMMLHGKSFLYGLCGIAQGRLGWAGQEMDEFRPQIEATITDAGRLKDQGFDTIHYAMRFGPEKLDPTSCKRRRRHQEQEVASVASMKSLHEVFMHRPILRAFLATEVRRIMEHIQAKYNLANLPELYSHLDHQIKQAESGEVNSTPQIV